MLVAFDDNLTAETTRLTNRSHGLPTQTHHALELVLDPPSQPGRERPYWLTLFPAS